MLIKSDKNQTRLEARKRHENIPLEENKPIWFQL